jgi:hypothetical protein
MSVEQREKQASGELHGGQQLADILAKAMAKIGGRGENELCKYLPAEGGGYLHHFTLRKMKTRSPASLHDLISKYILGPDRPIRLPHKRRAPRGTRKRRDGVALTRGDFERVMDLVRKSGDQDLMAKLSPQKNLPNIKRDLIRAIREGRVEAELWNLYVQTINCCKAVEGDIAAFQVKVRGLRPGHAE